MKLATTLMTTAAAGCAAGLMAAMGANFAGAPSSSAAHAVETVSVQPGALSYRLPGEFIAAGKVADAPLRAVELRGFDMMKYQVSAGDYALCVADGACSKADGAQAGGELPVTGVDHKDAGDYAEWLSQRTGENWRLPTDAEWAFAAAERFKDDSLNIADDDNNPAARWLARYRKEAGSAPSDPEPKPYGHFGTNSKGLADMAGNVWDWTSTCYVRAAVEQDGTLAQSVENCGIRIAGGRHRAYMSFFIRDGKSGGCAAGIAPHNLGIRLVRDRPALIAKVKALLRLS